MTTLHGRRLYSDEHRSVIVVESVDIRRENMDGSVGFFALSKPVAIVVSCVDNTYAVDINAQEVDFQYLVNNTHKLRSLLEG